LIGLGSIAHFCARFTLIGLRILFYLEGVPALARCGGLG